MPIGPARVSDSITDPGQIPCDIGGCETLLSLEIEALGADIMGGERGKEAIMQLTRSRRNNDYFYPLHRVRDQLNRLFDMPDLGGEDLLAGWAPAMDIQEKKEEFIVRAE